MYLYPTIRTDVFSFFLSHCKTGLFSLVSCGRYSVVAQEARSTNTQIHADTTQTRAHLQKTSGGSPRSDVGLAHAPPDARQRLRYVLARLFIVVRDGFQLLFTIGLLAVRPRASLTPLSTSPRFSLSLANSTHIEESRFTTTFILVVRLCSGLHKPTQQLCE